LPAELKFLSITLNISLPVTFGKKKTSLATGIGVGGLKWTPTGETLWQRFGRDGKSRTAPIHTLPIGCGGYSRWQTPRLPQLGRHSS
jgi:hypothetical protein